jgi:hypothetical protein
MPDGGRFRVFLLIEAEQRLNIFDCRQKQHDDASAGAQHKNGFQNPYSKNQHD